MHDYSEILRRLKCNFRYAKCGYRVRGQAVERFIAVYGKVERFNTTIKRYLQRVAHYGMSIHDFQRLTDEL